MADAPTLGARAPPGMGVQVPPRTPCRPPPTCETQARQGVASSVGVSGVVEPSKGLAADRRRSLVRMRRTGTPADPLGAGVGDHACLAYDDRAGWQAAAIAFLDEGARAGDRLLYTGHGTDDELVAALSALPGRDELLASGRLTLTRTVDLYGPPETFDADVQSAAYARAGRDARASGHRALRVAADMSPVVTAHPVRCGTDVPLFSVACRDDRIVIGGEVDAFVVAEFGEALEAAALVVDDPVRIDLSELRFLDAGATRRLAQFVQAQNAGDRQVVISGARRPARLCLSAFGLTGH